MPHIRTNWANYQSPAINALNLNNIEGGIWYSLVHSGGVRNTAEFLDRNPGSTTGGLAEAIADLAGAPGIVFAAPHNHPINGNYTIPANVHLMVSNGATFTVANAITLTINGTIEAGLYQIFILVGTGIAVLNNVKEVCPPWWGATATVGLAEAIASLGGSDRVVHLTPASYSINANYTVPANIHLIFANGASCAVANGIILTINGTLEAGLYQIFSWVGTGAVAFGDGAVKEVCPEWWGAKPDNATASKPAIDAAITAHRVVSLQKGIYIYHGKLTGLGVNGRVFEGRGSQNTIIHFTDDTVTALWEMTGEPCQDLRVKGITFQGPGKTAGVNVHGIYAHNNAGPYNCALEDVVAGWVSGTGIKIYDWFSSKYRDVGARECGGDGIEIGGDQAASFINSGTWNMNIDGYSWWFHGGTPFLQALNTGSCGNGIRFGRAPGHPLGASYCNPVIVGLNIEPILPGGIGIHFEAGSNFDFATGIQIYIIAPGVAQSGVFWESMQNVGLLARQIAFFGGGTYAGKEYDGNVGVGGSLIVLTQYDLVGLGLCSAAVGARLRTLQVLNYVFDQGDWQEVLGGVGFQNNWVNFGGAYATAGYFRDFMGVVHLKGLVKNGSGIPTAIFTLPAGYRPVATELYAVPSNDAYGGCSIDNGGVVTATVGSVTWFSLNGITFRAA